MARERSRSPARKKVPSKPAAKPATVESADVTGIAVAVAVLAVAWYRAAGADALTAKPLASFSETVNSGIVFSWPSVGPLDRIVGRFLGTSCNLITVLHALNQINGNAGTSGYWLNNFAQTLISAFAGGILLSVLNGTNMVNAIFADGPGLSVFSFFLLWYLVNYDIPACPVKFGLWDKITDFGGEGLDVLLGFGTAMFVTNLVCKVVGGPAEVFSTPWFQSVATGVVIGSAGSFFPLNKGIRFGKTEEARNALSISLFVASNGFKIVDFMITTALALVSDFTLGAVSVDYTFNVGGLANDLLCAPFGGVVGFVVAVSALNFLFGDHLPIKSGPGFDVFNCAEKTIAKFNL